MAAQRTENIVTTAIFRIDMTIDTVATTVITKPVTTANTMVISRVTKMAVSKTVAAVIVRLHYQNAAEATTGM